MRIGPFDFWTRCKDRVFLRLVPAWLMPVALVPVAFGLGCLALVYLAEFGRAEARSGDTQIRASYDVGVAAIDLGTFDLTATIGPNAYALKATGKFSILAGLLYRAEGKTESHGTRAAANATPKQFRLSYADSNRQQQLEIAFKNGAVGTVTRKPKKRPDKQAVPLSDAQLRGVLDPLTAAFLGIKATAPAGDLSVCNQILRVFEGRRLFELTLSPKRTEQLGARAPAGLRAAAVCAVRYRPIGGHRPQSRTVQFLQKSDGIEAWLVPVPGSDIVVPYRVVVPTAWGNGTAKLTQLRAQSAAASVPARAKALQPRTTGRYRAPTAPHRRR